MRLALTALVSVMAWILLSLWLYDTWKDKESKALAKDTAILETTYLASINRYRLATEILFEEVLKNPEVIDTFAEGIQAKGSAQAIERGKLYRLLASAYEHLREKGIRQLHFQTAEGISFLRFHAPDKYGDSLFDVRPTVRIANREKKVVASFEAGRVASGFRYIYPIFQKDKFLGTVETGVPFDVIRKAMAEVDSTREYALVLKRQAVEAILFPEQNFLYSPSSIHENFLVEDPNLNLPDSPPPPSPVIEALNARIRQNRQAQDGMTSGLTFTLPIFLNGEPWAVSFVPIKDVIEINEAYVLSYVKAPNVTTLRNEFILSMILGTVTLFVLILFTLVLMRSRRQLLEEKNHQLTVTDTIADGLYVMDNQGIITQVNPAFSEFLGYPPEEILGQSGHDVYHVDATGNLQSLDKCPIFKATGQGETYSGEELFRRKDGQLLSVEVSCKPILKDGKQEGSVIAFRDITDRKAADERIRFLAQYDPLTSLPNRTLLHDRLDQAISARYKDRAFALFFIDLDHFKNINDSLGHHAGDLLLQQVAERLSDNVRAEDTICRHGGDEFIIVSQEVHNSSSAAAIAQKILTAISQPYSIQATKLHVTASIGIVLYPQDGADKSTLIKHADSAMYHAKKNGRNNYQFFTKELNIQAVERLTMENSLRRALENQEFFLVYQPQVNLATSGIIGIEALIRWQSPDRGLIPPSQFISVAEDTGLIVPIGEWVIKEVCSQCRRWINNGTPLVPVSINISSQQIQQREFENTVAHILGTTGIGAECLDFEITESILMRDIENSVSMLKRLKSMGLKISIDDFGTGYSSLSYLKTFPIDRIKIDKSFIRDLSTDANDMAIASAIIAMSHHLRLNVIAEGVETTEQIRILKKQQCNEAQGFYYCTPLSAERIEELLRENRSLPVGQVH